MAHSLWADLQAVRKQLQRAWRGAPDDQARSRLRAGPAAPRQSTAGPRRAQRSAVHSACPAHVLLALGAIAPQGQRAHAAALEFCTPNSAQMQRFTPASRRCHRTSTGCPARLGHRRQMPCTINPVEICSSRSSLELVTNLRNFSFTTVPSGLAFRKRAFSWFENAVNRTWSKNVSQNLVRWSIKLLQSRRSNLS